MMTIDEAIAYAREVAEKNRNTCERNTIIIPNRYISNIDCAEEHEQIAQWLEELKAFRENKWTDIYIKRGYDKAIYDYKYLLVERLEAGRCVDGKFAYIDLCDIDEIAEQLKAGEQDA